MQKPLPRLTDSLYTLYTLLRTLFPLTNGLACFVAHMRPGHVLPVCFAAQMRPGHVLPTFTHFATL